MYDPYFETDEEEYDEDKDIIEHYPDEADYNTDIVKVGANINRFLVQYNQYISAGWKKEQLYKYAKNNLLIIETDFYPNNEFIYQKIIDASLKGPTEYQENILRDLFIVQFENSIDAVKQFDGDWTDWTRRWEEKFKKDSNYRLAKLLVKRNNYKDVALYLKSILIKYAPSKKNNTNRTKSNRFEAEPHGYEYSEFEYWEAVYDGEIDPTKESESDINEIGYYETHYIENKISIFRIFGAIERYIELIITAREITYEEKMEIFETLKNNCESGLQYIIQKQIDKLTKHRKYYQNFGGNIE